MVDVVLTESALKFVSALQFQSVTSRKAYSDADLWGGEAHVVHVNLGHSADLLVIAPVTASTMAKLACGLGDNLLSVTALASSCPVVLAPAMDLDMYQHPMTQKNVALLKKQGVTFIGPAEGHLASGLKGPGRFEEPANILAQLRYILSRGGPLHGKKIVVTAGGTQEPIDPVRLITNRSSGKQGYAVAQASLDSGADVTLISAETHLSSPAGAVVVHTQTVDEMLQHVIKETRDADALIMAAAVSDFKPAQRSDQKIKKEGGELRIDLVPTSDILMEVAAQKTKTGFPRVTVGFAAESKDLIKNAKAKLEKKKLDMIVANDISNPKTGFEVDENKVVFLYRDGSSEELPILPKIEVADRLIERLQPRLK